MVRRMISRLSVFVLLMIIVSACSKTKTAYTDVIPADATGVVSINLKALADKAGLDDKENQAMKQKMMDALKSDMNAATYEQMEKILKDPSESGIDTKAPVYLFTSPSQSFALVAKVSDESKLRKSLELAIKEFSQPISEADGFSYALIQNTMMAFNETAVIAVGVRGKSQVESAKTTIATLMKQTSENSIAKNAGFKKMLERKGDFNFFVSMKAIPAMYARQINLGLLQDVDLNDLMVLGDLNAEKGKIVGRFEYYTENEALKEQLKRQEKATSKLSGTFLKHFPASTLGFVSIGVNGEEFYKLLSENQMFRNQASLTEAAEIKELLHAFKGDLSFGILNVGVTNNLYALTNPATAFSYVVYAEIKDNNALKKVYENKQNLGLSRGEDIIQLSENNYLYKGRNMNLFFGVKDKQLYLTNDETAYKSIFKAADPSIKGLDYVSDIKGKSFFSVASMDAILELPAVKMLVNYGGEEAAMYYQLASKVSYIEYNTESGTTEIIFALKDKNTNALKQMVDFGRLFVGM